MMTPNTRTHESTEAVIQALRDELELERGKLSGFIASLGDALVVLDATGRIEFVNAEGERVLGRSRDELAGGNFAEIVSGGWPRERERRASLRKLHECIETWQPFRDDDARFMNAARAWVPVAFTLSPVRHGTSVSGAVIIFRDTSEHKRFERALRQSESRLRAVFNSAAVGIMRVDPSGEILDTNPAMAKMLGLEPDQLLGRTLAGLNLGPPDGPSAAVGGAGTGVEEHRCQHADGSAVWMQCTKTWVDDDAGKVLFGTVIVENVTERKQLEVSLRHAQKLESIGRLASGIAHEINTPVQFVCDNVHFMKGAFEELLRLVDHHTTLLAACPDAARTAAERAAGEADLPYLRGEIPKAVAQTLDGLSRVASVVHAMKSFAHPDAGDQSLADINSGLRNTLTIAGNELKSVAEIVEDFHDLPRVRCYPGDLNQVFLNLLVNAAHAIGDRGDAPGEPRRITVSTCLDGDHVVISIADTGGGIPEHVRAHLFEPFFTTKEVGRGTGQGLALSRAIVVEKHQGELTYDTTLGEGTTFHVRIPIAGTASPEQSAA